MLMVVFHLVFDLREFYSYNVKYLSGFWYYEGKLSAILFILTAGISSTFSKNNIKRGSQVFGLGMLLTIVTFVFTPGSYIKFGILHFMGSSMILYHFISNLKVKYLFLLGTAIIAFGNVFLKTSVASSYLFPLGLMNKNFISSDYYPLLPWFGVFLYGVIIGKTLYSEKKSLLASASKFELISYLGQHSLFIYLIHQPVLLALLFFIHKL